MVGQDDGLVRAERLTDPASFYVVEYDPGVSVMASDVQVKGAGVLRERLDGLVRADKVFPVRGRGRAPRRSRQARAAWTAQWIATAAPLTARPPSTT